MQLFFVSLILADTRLHVVEVPLIFGIGHSLSRRQTNRSKDQFILGESTSLVAEQVLNLAHLFVQVERVALRISNFIHFVVGLRHPGVLFNHIRVDDLRQTDNDNEIKWHK